MSLVPDVQPYTLPEIATAMWKLCRERGWRVGWVRPVLLTKPSRVSMYGVEPDVIGRDWLGRLVTDMPARLASEAM